VDTAARGPSHAARLLEPFTPMAVLAASTDWIGLVCTSGTADREAPEPCDTCPAGGVEAVVDLLVPELQRRGLFRRRYTGSTLREHLRLPRAAPRTPHSEKLSRA